MFPGMSVLDHFSSNTAPSTMAVRLEERNLKKLFNQYFVLTCGILGISTNIMDRSHILLPP